ncbi:MAG: hypothetical protein WBF64_08595, partial [Xanthobacteraceae bacterium]
AHDVLKWATQTALKEGLARTIAHFEELLRDEAIRPFIVHEQGARAWRAASPLGLSAVKVGHSTTSQSSPISRFIRSAPITTPRR